MPRAPGEFREALEALGPIGIERLHQLARARCFGTDLEPAELLNEAIERVLCGSRPWPVEIGLFAFLAGVMRSVADGDRQAIRRRSARFPASIDNPRTALGPHEADGRPGPEDRLLESEMLTQMEDQISAMFEGDFDAQMLVEGRMEGLRGEDLRSLTSLDPTKFASKQKLIDRRFAALAAKWSRP